MSGNNLDAFARLRVSDPTTLFDSQLQYNAQPLLWQSVGDGTATHVPAKAAVQMAVTAGQSLIRQSRAYVRYQPGKSQLILLTGVLGAAVVGVTKRIGYFDDDNGIFFELTSAGLHIVKRSKATGSVVDTRVAAADWNSGNAFGIEDRIDASKAQIFLIDLEWLGVGRVRCGFVIDGVPVVAHQFNHANLIDSVYMTTANLPLRYELVSTSGAASDMYQICSTVQSEGGFEQETGIPHSIGNGVTGISVSTRRAVLTIRPKATFGGIVNRGGVIPEGAAMLVTTAPIFYEIVYGSALGGTPSWASVGDNSIVEYDVAGTTVTGGEVLDSGYAVTSGSGVTARGSAQDSLLSRLPLVLDKAGANPLNLSLVATGIGGTAVVYGSLSWRELY